MFGKKESLNVAVAFGIVVYDLKLKMSYNWKVEIN
jgi:tRNA G18 (ribose-2'-O)-methylase SpoU